MIDILAAGLGIIGAPMIVAKTPKVRYAGYVIWIGSNILWIYLGWSTAMYGLIIQNGWFLSWCVLGCLNNKEPELDQRVRVNRPKRDL